MPNLSSREKDIERRCALTREVKPVAEMIRFAVSPDGELAPDTEAKAGGRGVWITLGQRFVAEAALRKAFERSLKEKVRLPEDLAGLTRRRLTERYLSALQMAKKAGQLVTGAFRVREAIDKGEVIALITATDAAADGREKMLSALRGRHKAALERGLEAAEVPHLQLLDSGQLGLAFGLESVIHAALINGAAAHSARKQAIRLARYIDH